MEGRLKEAMKETEEEAARERKMREGWWDKECEEKKREVRRKLRGWRRTGMRGEEYRKEKQEYKEMCERKKKEENERWERMAMEARREGDVWAIVNKERKKKRRINEDIGMEE